MELFFTELVGFETSSLLYFAALKEDSVDENNIKVDQECNKNEISADFSGELF